MNDEIDGAGRARSDIRLRVDGLTKRYGSILALDDVSFDLAAGEVTCLAGPNGSGKTTTVEIIEGLRKPDAGSVELLGRVLRPIDQRPAELGVQLQEESLPTRIKVSEAIGFYSRLHRLDGEPTELIQLLGLCDFWDSSYVALSGGQKRRVVIALALLSNPKVLVLDEPTSGLDPEGQETVVQLIDDLRRQGVAVLTTLHDMGQAEKLSDEVVLLHQGRVVRRGAPSTLVGEFGATHRLALPASLEIGADDYRDLGVTSTTTIGRRALLYGGDEMPGRLQSWDRFESMFADGDRTFELRRVGLVDVYLDLLGDNEARQLFDEVASDVEVPS